MHRTTKIESLVTTTLFDIPNVKNSGQLILPLSMAKLHTEQNPQEIYDFLAHFEERIQDAHVDVYLLYTNGLHFNTKEDSLDLRRKSSSKISRHAQTLKSIVDKKGKFIPKAFHYLAWDSLILNCPLYSDFLSLLNKEYSKKSTFYDAVTIDIESLGRNVNEENICFILEELVVTHIIRQKLISLPTCLSCNSDSWRLISYPGNALISDVSISQGNILPRNNEKRFTNKYHNAFYDWKNKILLDYDRMDSICNSIPSLKEMAAI